MTMERDEVMLTGLRIDESCLLIGPFLRRKRNKKSATPFRLMFDLHSVVSLLITFIYVACSLTKFLLGPKQFADKTYFFIDAKLGYM